MPHQNAGAGDSILVMIALVAMVVFILMLFAAFVIIRSEGKIKNKAVAEQVSLFSQDKPRHAPTARQSAILASLKTRCCGAGMPSSDLRSSRRINP